MKRLIWDLPTRAFHWLLAFSVLAAYGFAEFASKETPWFYLHVVFGVLAGLLILWRIIWGFVGSSHAKWRALLFSPKDILGYFSSIAQGKGVYHAGHNPGGALAIWGILGATALTVVSGFLIAQAEMFEELHEVFPNLLMILIIFHVAGVVFATIMNKENYAMSMVTGKKRAEPGEAIPSNSMGALVVMLLLIGGGWGYFIKGFDRQTAVFTAPGTQWSFQVGEPEDEGAEHEKSEDEMEDDD